MRHLLLPASFLLLFAFQTTEALRGIYVDDVIAANMSTCLLRNDFYFMVVRLWKNAGYYDNVGFGNLKRARNAGFDAVDGLFVPCLTTSCAAVENQVEAVINQLKNQNAFVGIFWIDVQDKNWGVGDTYDIRRQWLQSMIDKATSMGQEVGIYTNNGRWKELIGYTDQQQFPLWDDANDRHMDFGNYAQYGGWQSPYMKTYQRMFALSCTGKTLNDQLYMK